MGTRIRNERWSDQMMRKSKWQRTSTSALRGIWIQSTAMLDLLCNIPVYWALYFWLIVKNAHLELVLCHLHRTLLPLVMHHIQEIPASIYGVPARVHMCIFCHIRRGTFVAGWNYSCYKFTWAFPLISVGLWPPFWHHGPDKGCHESSSN